MPGPECLNLSRKPQTNMAKLVFRLKYVPAEEAEAVRSLLHEHNIPFYETDAGNWGISMAGIWVKENADVEQARRLIDTYQQSLANENRFEETPSILESLLQRPVISLLALAFLAVILYFSLKPFIFFGQ